MTETMRAMVLDAPGRPLELREAPLPEPGPGQVRIRVSACAVCRTDLHVIDGDLPSPTLPLVLGHEIVGVVDSVGGPAEETGEPVSLEVGDRVGVPWLGSTCGRCAYCHGGAENLCDDARFTGYQIDGGYAEATIAEARFCFPLPETFDDAHAAPLLCAGLIGYRCLRMAGDPRRVGLYGFGAAAHILCQLATAQGREVFAFTRWGDDAGQRFAKTLGAVWAGGSDEPSPTPLDAAIIFAPVGALVPTALRAVRKGGVVVCGGIHMSAIPSFPYEILWGERVVRSVANLTRADGVDFFAEVARHPVRTEVVEYPLERANEALDDLRAGRFEGAAVLRVAHAR